MNGQFMEYWERTMTAALRDQNQIEMMTAWFQKTFRDMTPLTSVYSLLWGWPWGEGPLNSPLQQWGRVWEPVLRIQQLFLQWMGTAPFNELASQSKKIARLEAQVREQAREIHKLQALINQAGFDNNELVGQFQELIDQQGKQFQQLTSSMGDYIKSSTEKNGSRKQS